MDGRLRIDLESFAAQLASHPVRVVVLIHYFGYLDPNYVRAVELARAAGATVLEDSAHAMLTDLVGGGCGRLGDASIYSLHKMFPTPSGGMLVQNGGTPNTDSSPADLHFPFWSYDLLGISERRRANAQQLTELLQPLSSHVEPLWPILGRSEVPQTYPVLIHGLSRFDLYLAMNEAGHGVVSLYHTMIEQLNPVDYPDAHQIASTILNLPVHQDTSADALRSMVDFMTGAIEQLAQPRETRASA
jgi:dTDP-4-amino-4,6-dideoxygalactose transaminase